MKYFDWSAPSPAGNLACDEALLDLCDAGETGDILRFWEPGQPFVVLGYANHAATEANLPACAQRHIPVLRRCSGGGAVVQAPGCLNYSLILRIPDTGPLQTITGANQFIMSQQRSAIESALSFDHTQADHYLPAVHVPSLPNTQHATRNSSVSIAGHTDLALGPLKFSGNAQRRKRHALLFHGSFLLNADLAFISELLRMPSKQPDYRQGRSHTDFLTNLNLPAATLKQSLLKTWNAAHPFLDPPTTAIEDLTRTKYTTDAWNLKF